VLGEYPWAERIIMKKHGFTIVELLIVIVVIAILAAITTVSYSGIQSRARDAVRKNDLVQLGKAMSIYSMDKGDLVDAGCGSGTGYGWLSIDYDGGGPLKSINDCLIAGGYLQRALKDPAGLESCSGLTCYAYMKATCAGGTYLYAHLETVAQTSTDTDATCYPTWDTTYGVNYALKVN